MFFTLFLPMFHMFLYPASLVYFLNPLRVNFVFNSILALHHSKAKCLFSLSDFHPAPEFEYSLPPIIPFVWELNFSHSGVSG